MSTTAPAPPHSTVALADREGEAHWFFGGLYTLKATGADTGGAMTVFEVLAGVEAGPPLHVHEREDEALYVLEGEIELHVGDLVTRLGPGGCAFAPRRVPHTWAVTSEPPARLFAVATPAGFDDFVRAFGEPAPALTLPPVPDTPPDPPPRSPPRPRPASASWAPRSGRRSALGRPG
jgi:mannose-6-phosphate isomerase-like protein (cupin superfamily)